MIALSSAKHDLGLEAAGGGGTAGVLGLQALELLVRGQERDDDGLLAQAVTSTPEGSPAVMGGSRTRYSTSEWTSCILLIGAGFAASEAW